MKLSPAKHVPCSGMYREMEIAYLQKCMKKTEEEMIKEKTVLYGNDGQLLDLSAFLKRS